MKVSALYIYPIKSLQGIAAPSAEVLEKGFRYDRRWMLVDESGNQLTQRTHNQLSQVSIQIAQDYIVASHEGISDIKIPLTLTRGQNTQVKIWGDEVNAWSYSPVADEWFSQVAGTTCRLVFMPEIAGRLISSGYTKHEEQVSFADGHPYLIIGENSLADLNNRLSSPVPMNRFRPNIVFEGGEAYIEDSWTGFQIGNVEYYGCHPCIRCVFTTIDQETGKKGKEPLKTLAAYRSDEQGVIFGVNAIAKSMGVIKVGDALEEVH